MTKSMDRNSAAAIVFVAFATAALPPLAFGAKPNWESIPGESQDSKQLQQAPTGRQPGQPAPPSSAPRPAQPGGRAPAKGVETQDRLKAEQLTKEQFDRLPDAQAIDVKGQRMTAGEIRAKMRQAAAEAEAKAKAADARAQAAFEAHRTKFLQEQKTKLDAENAKVQAEATRLRQQRPAVPPAERKEAIRREASELHRRSQTASPAEQQQIEQRAAQLLQELQQMGVSGPPGAAPGAPPGPPPVKAPVQPQQRPRQLPLKIDPLRQ